MRLRIGTRVHTTAEPAEAQPVLPVVVGVPSLLLDDTAPLSLPDDPEAPDDPEEPRVGPVVVESEVVGSAVVESALVSLLPLLPLLAVPLWVPPVVSSVPLVEVAGGPAVGKTPPSWHSPACVWKSEPTRWQHPSASQV